MTAWTEQELDRFRTEDDLHVAPYREDGTTPGTPTWIWSVVVEDAVYVRAYNGTASRWFGAARSQGAGEIRTDDRPRRVTYVVLDDGGSVAAIDDAYRVKYAGSPYLGNMVGQKAQGATVRIEPAD